MNTLVKIGDKMTTRVEGLILHGVVILVYEDYIIVQWENGVCTPLDDYLKVESMRANKTTMQVA